MSESNGHRPDHSHEGMNADDLREHNLAELGRGIGDLIVHNESRLSLLRDVSNPWVELQFEMMSLKLDLLVDGIASLVSSDPELQLLNYGMNFQVLLSQHLDSLFPNTAPQGPSPPEGA